MMHSLTYTVKNWLIVVWIIGQQNGMIDGNIGPRAFSIDLNIFLCFINKIINEKATLDQGIIIIGRWRSWLFGCHEKVTQESTSPRDGQQ